MGDIREIHHTYRIDPRTQQSISVQKKPPRDETQKEKREEPQDEILLTHLEPEETADQCDSVKESPVKPEEIPGLDISA